MIELPKDTAFSAKPKGGWKDCTGKAYAMTGLFNSDVQFTPAGGLGF